ncbi:MAG: hypothetical protein WA761_05140 [Thermoplasmata archaeon]
MRSTLRPVEGAAALRFEEDVSGPATLLIADLHLGLGGDPTHIHGPPEGSAPILAEELLAVARQAGTGRIIIVGDVKHPIVGTPRLLRPVIFDFFGTLLESGLSIEVVLGNHDVGLTPHLPKEVEVHPASGIVRGGIGIFHGHRWPSSTVLRAEQWVVGHLHPGFRFAATAQHVSTKQRVWVHVRYPPAPKGTGRRRSVRRRPFRGRELTVLPAFNPLSGTEALNRQRPARIRSFLYQRFLAPGESRAYLMDGTDLGTIATRSPSVPRTARDREVSPGR